METVLEQKELVGHWQRHLQPLHWYSAHQNLNGKQSLLKMSSHSKSTNHMGKEALQRELEDLTHETMQVPRTRNDKMTKNINMNIFRTFKELKEIRKTNSCYYLTFYSFLVAGFAFPSWPIM